MQPEIPSKSLDLEKKINEIGVGVRSYTFNDAIRILTGIIVALIVYLMYRFM